MRHTSVVFVSVDPVITDLLTELVPDADGLGSGFGGRGPRG